MLVTLCSGKGSPGVSTLACVMGAVWPARRDVVIAECDPSGNDLAVRFGLVPRHGMASLVLAERNRDDSEASLGPHLQALPGGLSVLTGPVNLEAARVVDLELAGLGHSIFRSGADVLIDCGRLLSDAPGQRAMVKLADHVLVCTKQDVAGIAHAQQVIEAVRTASGASLWLVTVGEGPFPEHEIERVTGAEVLDRVPTDIDAAGIACGMPGAPRLLARSRLVESARRIVGRLLREEKEPEPIPEREPEPDAISALPPVPAEMRTSVGRPLVPSNPDVALSNGKTRLGDDR